MDIGIIGHGVVGQALDFGFKKLGHTVKVHDIKYDTKIDDLLDTDIIYVCVPTPALPNGKCDVSIVKAVLTELQHKNYKGDYHGGYVVIKSTVPPGTTEAFRNCFPNLELAFVPEFLRERCAITDFVENHTLLAIGAYHAGLMHAVKLSHGNYPKKIIDLTPTEAELLKYYSNVFNAMRVIFANEMYEVAQAVDADYQKVKNAFIAKGGIDDIYLDVNDNFRGYGGVCLPKDVKALAYLAKQLNLDLALFETLDQENKKFKTTVPQGMRL